MSSDLKLQDMSEASGRRMFCRDHTVACPGEERDRVGKGTRA